MSFLDVLTQLQDLNTIFSIVVPIVLVALLVYVVFASRSRRRHGWRAVLHLEDWFKVRYKRRSRKEQHALAQGNSVTLGTVLHAGWWWMKQPLIIPESARCFNVLSVAPVGAGKTFFYLVTFIAQDLSRPNVCVIVLDGQQAITEEVIALAAQHHREVVVYPDAGFNPLRGPGSPEATAALFGDVWAQVVEIPTTGPARYYTERAQSFLRKVVPLYERAYQQPMILRELLELCLSDTLRSRLVADGAGTPEARAYHLLCGGWSKSDFDSSLSGLVNFLDRLLIERNAWLYNQRFAPTLLECIQQKKVVLIRAGGARDTTQHTEGLLYMTLLQAYAERRRVQPTSPLLSVYMDEAHMYFNRNFPTFIATARKKLVALHLGFQSFKQLAPHGPIITTNCRTWILHGGLEYDDALLVANNIGKRNYRTRTWTTGGRQPRQTFGHRWEYLVPPHEIRGLGEKEALVLTVEGQKREVASHAFVEKPGFLRLATTPYEEPPVPAAPPMTIWEERDQQHLVIAASNGQQQTPSLGQPAGQQTLDW